MEDSIHSVEREIFEDHPQRHHLDRLLKVFEMGTFSPLVNHQDLRISMQSTFFKIKWREIRSRVEKLGWGEMRR